MKFTKFGKALLMSALSAGVVLSVTSCVQSYTVGYLYVTGTVTAQSSGNGIITGFKIDHNTGKLTPINGLPVSSGGANPVRAVLLTGSRFLYVLNRGVNATAGSSICTTAVSLHRTPTSPSLRSAATASSPRRRPSTPRASTRSASSPTVRETTFTCSTTTPRTPPPRPAIRSCATLERELLGCPDRRHHLRRHHRLPGQRDHRPPDPGGQQPGHVSNCGTSSTSCPLTYFPVPANPIDFVLASSNFLTLSGTPATGDSVFPYTYSAGSGQLTVNQNSSQPLNAHAATAIDSGGGYIYVLDNEPITYTPTGSSTPVTAPSQILPFTVGTNGALQAQTGGAVPDDPTLANPIA